MVDNDLQIIFEHAQSNAFLILNDDNKFFDQKIDPYILINILMGIYIKKYRVINHTMKRIVEAKTEPHTVGNGRKNFIYHLFCKEDIDEINDDIRLILHHADESIDHKDIKEQINFTGNIYTAKFINSVRGALAFIKYKKGYYDTDFYYKLKNDLIEHVEKLLYPEKNENTKQEEDDECDDYDDDYDEDYDENEDIEDDVERNYNENNIEGDDLPELQSEENLEV
jgi:hypothetical protein